jgi:hypothetical protein
MSANDEDPEVNLQTESPSSLKRWQTIFKRKNKVTPATHESLNSLPTPQRNANDSYKSQDAILPLTSNTDTPDPFIKLNKNSWNRASVAPVARNAHYDKAQSSSDKSTPTDGDPFPVGSLLQQQSKSSVVIRNVEGSFHHFVFRLPFMSYLRGFEKAEIHLKTGKSPAIIRSTIPPNRIATSSSV